MSKRQEASDNDGNFDALGPYSTPVGWALVRVRDVGEVRLGRQRSPQHHQGLHMRPYLRVANVFEDRIDTRDVMEMNFTPQEYETYRLEPGDILLNEGQSLELVGRPAMYRGEVPGSCFQNTLVRFRAGQAVRPSYALLIFRHYLHSGIFQKIATRTVNIAHLSASRFAELGFPLPPPAEQDRIVAATDEHFTRISAGIAALESARARLRRYRASVLKAACEGRLVPTEAELARAEGRDYEPADRLLARILQHRRSRWEADQLAKLHAQGKPPKDDRWKARYAEPNLPDTSSLPVLPEGWTWAAAAQIAEIQGGIQKQPKRTPKENAYPFLRVANVYRNRLDLDEVHQIELFGDELDKLRLEPGDLLIVEGNGSPTEIGRMAIWNGSISDCVHQNHIIRARLIGDLPPSYVGCYWNSPDGSSRVMQVSSSTSGLHTLSVAKVSALPVPLPPLAEQHRIVTEVDRRLSLINALDAALAAGLKRADRLRQAILKRAFAGRLVPQDPADEPASALLERLRTGPDRSHGKSSGRSATPTPAAPDRSYRKSTSRPEQSAPEGRDQQPTLFD
jgi:type I restriction enzyme S subunit